jgi:hypothetical protein
MEKAFQNAGTLTFMPSKLAGSHENQVMVPGSAVATGAFGCLFATPCPAGLAERMRTALHVA